MKKDIENREDIDLLMQSFYSKAITDEQIGYIFTNVAKLDLEHHLPIIGDFWETLLFRTGDYGSRNGALVPSTLPVLSDRTATSLPGFAVPVSAVVR